MYWWKLRAIQGLRATDISPLAGRMTVVHTSKHEAGQIYVREVNTALMLGCLLVVVGAAGKMGRTLMRVVDATPGVTLAAAIERRSVLPERVLGSSVTKCTAFGRPMAPSCRSTVSMISCGVVFFEGSFKTAKARGI